MRRERRTTYAIMSQFERKVGDPSGRSGRQLLVINGGATRRAHPRDGSTVILSVRSAKQTCGFELPP